MKVKDIKLIVVPYYDSLSVKRNFRDIVDIYPGIDKYFPMYDEEYLPSRKFFWEIFATLHYNEASKIIENERNRKYVKEEQEKRQVIAVDPIILNELQAVNYFSKSKGRALYNMKAKRFELPERKRRFNEMMNGEDNKNSHPFVVTKLNKRRKIDTNNSDSKQRNLPNKYLQSTESKINSKQRSSEKASQINDPSKKVNKEIKSNPFAYN
jgi:hypothetical protein